MKLVQVREFKARLASYLRLVEGGEVVAVTRHRRPIAVVSPPRKKLPGNEKLPEEEWFQAALGEGVVVPGDRRSRERRVSPSVRRLSLRAVRQLLRDRRR